MKRLRLALLLLAGGLALPVVLLVAQSLESVAFEREVRHEAVAERAFDEMERALSRFLEQEEARPFEHYRFDSRGAENGTGEPPELSPLSHTPDEPFVVGYFQIDPDGSLHTPSHPRDPKLAKRSGDRIAGAGADATPERLEEVVTLYWSETAEREQPARTPATALLGAFEEFPGVQLSFAPSAGGPPDELQEEKTDKDRPAVVAAAKQKKQATAYDVLKSFNLGAQQRADRKQTVTEEPYSAVYGRAERSSAHALRQEALEFEERFGRRHTPDDAAVTRHGISASLEDLSESRSTLQHASGLLRAATEAARVRVTRDPMVGRVIDERHLILYRTVVVGKQGYRQGLLIDRRELGRWLDKQVVSASALANAAQLRFPDNGDGFTTTPEPGDYVFEHRFAEPFDSLRAQLWLEPLPGVGSAGTVYALATLLGIVAVAGLIAVYRMAAVVVQFAERRNSFVASVSHELKTPVTAIRMYGEMLRDGLVPSESKRAEYYATITDESERLSRLIDNVLEFSRLERGQRVSHFSVGDIEPVLAEAVEKLRPQVKREGFDLQLVVEKALPPLRFDRDAVLQVLFNLVDNAMKYARGAGNKQVVIEGRREGAGVAISVRDFGPGVSKRHIGKVFEPFYRGEDELTRNTKGTGIGLALVKELAEQMGAAVSGANVEGGGFRVSLTFTPT